MNWTALKGGPIYLRNP